ncbi:unnamed protein product [Fusarium graminearum]|nr:unnamed protein product [Fusarium graminearum]VTO83694.1 unnamed protein product [Fusarium graminearum]
MYELALFTASAGLECLSPLPLSGIWTAVPDVKHPDIGFRDILLDTVLITTGQRTCRANAAPDSPAPCWSTRSETLDHLETAAHRHEEI